MDVKVTLSFDASVIERAKKFADKHKMSLSRLTEYLYDKLTHQSVNSLEELTISDWVTQVAEGGALYKTRKRGRKALRNEYLKSRK